MKSPAPASTSTAMLNATRRARMPAGCISPISQIVCIVCLRVRLPRKVHVPRGRANDHWLPKCRTGAEREASTAAKCRRRMETAAAGKHLENAAAKAAATKVRADSNSDGVSGYRGLNHHGRNHDASYFRDSCYFHVTTLAYRSAKAASSLRKQK
jgi:hypothetical protein